ncbi:hypothetical protein HPP92_026882 [Vanilla planifolia]|uniref:Uncharacterized protein n=1 Tax=Vanilla planifolia TaxID=51239 RepID=A0A835PCH3_VANPL|nr:hypothetical protein HPP92_026882 [Vanilla planifolia]
MDSAPLLSPSSDEQLWSSLQNRVEAILEDRKAKQPVAWPFSACDAESKRVKRITGDSLLLIRGLDSVSSSLSQLTESLGAAQKGLKELAKPTSRKVYKRENQRAGDEDEQPNAKKQCLCTYSKVEENPISMSNLSSLDSKKEAFSVDEHKDEQIAVDPAKNVTLKAKELAVSMVSKAALLARELKMVRKELDAMQERCAQLEGENIRLREGFEKGAMPEEDDLVRLQLEALLSEKSRLANENANLIRENQCLHQLVEYHQLTAQDISFSDEDVIHGLRLDFSSLEGIEADELDDVHGDLNSVGEPIIPPSNIKMDSNPLDEESKEENKPTP